MYIVGSSKRRGAALFRMDKLVDARDADSRRCGDAHRPHQPIASSPRTAALGAPRAPPLTTPPPSPIHSRQELEIEKDNATYVRRTKQELQRVVDALAQRKEVEPRVRARDRGVQRAELQARRAAPVVGDRARPREPRLLLAVARPSAYMAMEKFDRALKDANECVRLAADVGEGLLAPGRRASSRR